MNAVSFTTANPSNVCELAQRRLRESPYYFLRSLTCHVNRGVLVLRGRVPHNRLREFAEAIVARVDGVQSIENQVEVCDPASWARSA